MIVCIAKAFRLHILCLLSVIFYVNSISASAASYVHIRFAKALQNLSKQTTVAICMSVIKKRDVSPEPPNDYLYHSQLARLAAQANFAEGCHLNAYTHLERSIDFTKYSLDEVKNTCTLLYKLAAFIGGNEDTMDPKDLALKLIISSKEAKETYDLYWYQFEIEAIIKLLSEHHPEETGLIEFFEGKISK